MLPLAVSLGDPAGIGPEIIVEAYVRREEEGIAPFFVVGGASILEAAAASRDRKIEIVTIADPASATDAWRKGLPVLGTDDAIYAPGQPDTTGANLALYSLVEATSRAALGEAGGLVTAPISKLDLAQVGFTQPGQTEFLADACGIDREDAVMMLAGPSLRVVPLTVHCALSEVPERLTSELIIRRAKVVHKAMESDFGIANPRLAVAGLNPHASEGGRFGDEEAAIIAPAIAQLEQEGMRVTGPIPGDALFTPRARQAYDVALAMYHDQALIPIKALDFDEGVNVTLGLPIVRTSPDHGTAFDIAGKGRADPGAMIAALKLAGDLAAKRSNRD